MARGKDRGCLLGCLTRITSLAAICVVLAATAYFGSRLLWVPDWQAGPPDPAAVQAFSGIASIALGEKRSGPLPITEADANAFLSFRYPSDPVRVSFLDQEIEFGAVARPWRTRETFLPDGMDAGIRAFRIFFTLRGRPVIDGSTLRIEPTRLVFGKQPIPLWVLRLSNRLAKRGLPEFPVPAAVKSVENEKGRIVVTLQ